MAERFEIRLSGEGGQGLVLAGKVLAEAAALYDGKNATQSQSYGPEARGGASRSDVIISTGEIDYPKAVNLDILLALTQESVDKYIKDLKKGGILVVDSDTIHNIPKGDFKVIKAPIIRLAREEIGKVIVANMVALGVIVGMTNVVSQEAAENALLTRVPKGTQEINLKAFNLGLEEAKKAKASANEQ